MSMDSLYKRAKDFYHRHADSPAKGPDTTTTAAAAAAAAARSKQIPASPATTDGTASAGGVLSTPIHSGSQSQHTTPVRNSAAKPNTDRTKSISYDANANPANTLLTGSGGGGGSLPSTPQQPKRNSVIKEPETGGLKPRALNTGTPIAPAPAATASKLTAATPVGSGTGAAATATATATSTAAAASAESDYWSSGGASMAAQFASAGAPLAVVSNDPLDRYRAMAAAPQPQPQPQTAPVTTPSTLTRSGSGSFERAKPGTTGGTSGTGAATKTAAFGSSAAPPTPTASTTAVSATPTAAASASAATPRAPVAPRLSATPTSTTTTLKQKSAIPMSTSNTDLSKIRAAAAAAMNSVPAQQRTPSKPQTKRQVSDHANSTSLFSAAAEALATAVSGGNDKPSTGSGAGPASASTPSHAGSAQTVWHPPNTPNQLRDAANRPQPQQIDTRRQPQQTPSSSAENSPHEKPKQFGTPTHSASGGSGLFTSMMPLTRQISAVSIGQSAIASASGAGTNADANSTIESAEAKEEMRKRIKQFREMLRSADESQKFIAQLQPSQQQEVLFVLEMDELLPRINPSMSNSSLRALIERTVHIYIHPAADPTHATVIKISKPTLRALESALSVVGLAPLRGSHYSGSTSADFSSSYLVPNPSPPGTPTSAHQSALAAAAAAAQSKDTSSLPRSSSHTNLAGGTRPMGRTSSHEHISALKGSTAAANASSIAAAAPTAPPAPVAPPQSAGLVAPIPSPALTRSVSHAAISALRVTDPSTIPTAPRAPTPPLTPSATHKPQSESAAAGLALARSNTPPHHSSHPSSLAASAASSKATIEKNERNHLLAVVALLERGRDEVESCLVREYWGKWLEHKANELHVGALEMDGVLVEAPAYRSFLLYLMADNKRHRTLLFWSELTQFAYMLNRLGLSKLTDDGRALFGLIDKHSYRVQQQQHAYALAHGPQSHSHDSNPLYSGAGGAHPPHRLTGLDEKENSVSVGSGEGASSNLSAPTTPRSSFSTGGGSSSSTSSSSNSSNASSGVLPGSTSGAVGMTGGMTGMTASTNSSKSLFDYSQPDRMLRLAELFHDIDELQYKYVTSYSKAAPVTVSPHKQYRPGTTGTTGGGPTGSFGTPSASSTGGGGGSGGSQTVNEKSSNGSDLTPELVWVKKINDILGRLGPLYRKADKVLHEAWDKFGRSSQFKLLLENRIEKAREKAENERERQREKEKDRIAKEQYAKTNAAALAAGLAPAEPPPPSPALNKPPLKRRKSRGLISFLKSQPVTHEMVFVDCLTPEKPSPNKTTPGIDQRILDYVVVYRATPSTTNDEKEGQFKITLDARFPEDDRPELPLNAGLHELCFPMNADVNGLCNCHEPMNGGFDHDFDFVNKTRKSMGVGSEARGFGLGPDSDEREGASTPNTSGFGGPSNPFGSSAASSASSSSASASASSSSSTIKPGTGPGGAANNSKPSTASASQPVRKPPPRLTHNRLFNFVLTATDGKRTYGAAMQFYDDEEKGGSHSRRASLNTPVSGDQKAAPAGGAKPATSGPTAPGGAAATVDDDDSSDSDSDDDKLPAGNPANARRASSTVMSTAKPVNKLAGAYGGGLKLVEEVNQQPYCVCILSSQPFVDLLRDCLESLPSHASIETVKSSPAFARLIAFTKPSAVPLDLFASRSTPLQVPGHDFSLQVLFRCLNPRRVLSALESLLMEKKVLMTSNHLSVLTIVGEALVSLLYPFQWLHLFVPMLPLSMFKYLQCPTPFLIGVHSCYASKAFELLDKDVVLIDLDNDDVLTRTAFQGERLPSAYKRLLIHRCRKFFYPDITSYDVPHSTHHHSAYAASLFGRGDTSPLHPTHSAPPGSGGARSSLTTIPITDAYANLIGPIPSRLPSPSAGTTPTALPVAVPPAAAPALASGQNIFFAPSSGASGGGGGGFASSVSSSVCTTPSTSAPSTPPQAVRVLAPPHVTVTIPVALPATAPASSVQPSPVNVDAAGSAVAASVSVAAANAIDMHKPAYVQFGKGEDVPHPDVEFRLELLKMWASLLKGYRHFCMLFTDERDPCMLFDAPSFIQSRLDNAAEKAYIPFLASLCKTTYFPIFLKLRTCATGLTPLPPLNVPTDAFDRYEQYASQASFLASIHASLPTSVTASFSNVSASLVSSLSSAYASPILRDVLINSSAAVRPWTISTAVRLFGVLKRIPSECFIETADELEKRRKYADKRRERERRDREEKARTRALAAAAAAKLTSSSATYHPSLSHDHASGGGGGLAGILHGPVPGTSGSGFGSDSIPPLPHSTSSGKLSGRANDSYHPPMHPGGSGSTKHETGKIGGAGAWSTARDSLTSSTPGTPAAASIITHSHAGNNSVSSMYHHPSTPTGLKASAVAAAAAAAALGTGETAASASASAVGGGGMPTGLQTYHPILGPKPKTGGGLERAFSIMPTITSSNESTYKSQGSTSDTVYSNSSLKASTPAHAASAAAGGNSVSAGAASTVSSTDTTTSNGNSMKSNGGGGGSSLLGLFAPPTPAEQQQRDSIVGGANTPVSLLPAAVTPPANATAANTSANTTAANTTSVPVVITVPPPVSLPAATPSAPSGAVLASSARRMSDGSIVVAALSSQPSATSQR